MRSKRDNLVRFSELLALPVCDAGGETVGRLDDLVVETGDNRLAYVSLRLDPATGDDRNRVVTVPWSAVSVRPGDRAVLKVAVRNETLRRLARR